MVNALGKCVAAADNYDPDLDFRSAEASTATSEARIARLQFRASDATYCAVDDKLCIKCRVSVFPRVAGNATSSSGGAVEPATAATAFCYGTSNCVCIVACESTSWSENVGGTKCPSDSNYSSKAKYYHHDSGMKTWEILLIVIVAAVVVVLAAAALFRRHRREDRAPMWIVDKMFKRCRRGAPKQSAAPGPTTDRGEEGGDATATAGSAGSSASAAAATTSSAESGPKREGLSLFGWRVMREELIDSENHRLARLDEERSPAAGFLQFADTTPSAPRFDDDVDGCTADVSKPSAPSHEP
ncbi:hypothetical protein PybrP1_009762 [[Pythium] brassicae (nom. inval.)]|nr:hypothetical protein PybrP1_009762 [[Pythium] brassicae (nom. inval.)]